MATLSENLKKLLDEARLSESQLARNTGISQPIINRMVTGVTKNPNVDTLRPIAKFFAVSISQLVGDEPLPKGRALGTYAPGEKGWTDIPLIQWEHIPTWKKTKTDVTYEDMIRTQLDVTQDAYALKVTNSAMEPKFAKNTVLIVEPHLSPKDRDYVIIQIEEQKPVFKQIIYDGENVYLKSANPDIEIVKMKKNHKIMGVVVEARLVLAAES